MPKKSTPIQIVTWNVKRQGASVLDALKDLPQLDVLTLQEVTVHHREDFEKYLRNRGFECSPDSHRRAGGKDYGNLIAIGSRLTFDPNKPRYAREKLPLPESLVEASVSVNGRSFLIINVHIPNGSGYGWKKIDTFKALRNTVRRAKGVPLIVMGDFNEPQYTPLVDGHVVTWGQDWDGREGAHVFWKSFRGRRDGKRWDREVRWVFEDGDGLGLRHAYWEAHGHGAMAVSHVTRGHPRWFDHMFVSPHFCVELCEYLHELRGPSLSDHSALEAKLLLKAG